MRLLQCIEKHLSFLLLEFIVAFLFSMQFGESNDPPQFRFIL